MHGSVILVIAISLAGCKKEPVSTQNAPTQAAAETQAEPSKPALSAVKLVEGGREPRRVLRSTPAPGQKERLEMRVDSELDARLAMLDAKQAPRSMTFEVTVQTKEGVHDGTHVVAFAVDEARVVDAAGLAPKVRKDRQEATAILRELEGSYLVDPHGAVQEVVMNLPSGASREAWSIAGDLKWALRQLAAPFPEEPIGAGAKWTIDRGVEQWGVSANEVATCEITKFEKQLVTVKTGVQQTAAAQTFRSPGSHADVELTDFAAEGAGEIAWDPTRLLPRSAKIVLTETRHIRYEVERQPVTAKVVTRRSLTIPLD